MKPQPSAMDVSMAPPDDIVYPETIPFVLVHLACLGVFWTGASLNDWILCVALYTVRMWAVTAGYHRYFSHRSFKTNRVFQFILAFAAQTSTQRGIIWWAAIHRSHHRHSDTPEDVHSPLHHGFFFSHVGWIFSSSKGKADYSLVKDLTRYPELVWLDRYRYLPGFLLALVLLLTTGWSGLITGFFFSTVLLYHGSFSINSIAHVMGRQRYLTGDDSRNNFWLALVTLGEGWHNNHHYYQSTTKAGFRWYEIDITYYVLKALSWCGIVYDLRPVPAHVVRGELKPTPSILERTARQLAESFCTERITRQIREAWTGAPSLDEFSRLARSQARAYLESIHLPHFPSLEELRAQAEEMFSHLPSVDDVVERAREILVEAVSVRLTEATA